ncbi:MAG: PLDc N-terminal domain-containing protein [Eubacterium sp.]|nr:PLDc N-terminal domain-containing protein [Eubacterium sp.]
MSSVLKADATQENKASVKNGVKRLVFVGIALLLEIVLDLGVILWLNQYSEWLYIISRIFAAILVLYIYNQNKTSAMKMPWIILIMALPILGMTTYALIGLNPGMHSMRERYKEIDAKILPLLSDDSGNIELTDSSMPVPKRVDLAEEHLREIDPGAANIASYLSKRAKYPAYENIPIVYYDDGAKGLEAQKEELRKAQKFIFMEYHAIENAESWHGIQEILEDRVKAGVEVRVFYDDMGSIGFIDTDFVKLMESKGIRCRVFNPFTIGLNLFLNNRDHRKITVIDGHVAFTGGYNLANEYFHLTEPFGYWKDTGIKIYGPAVRSFTDMFLEMWNAINGDDDNDTDFTQYLHDVTVTDQAPDTEAVEASAETADAGTVKAKSVNAIAESGIDPAASCGFVIPYGDIPLDDEHVGEDVYISIAEYAIKYAWYVTPYLILTDEMIHALGLAAKRGVDVRIITPGIPDKPLIYSITRSYYQNLVRNGVRIFEYTPGFCHCKMSVTDDAIATCGTINMDYRSLYHHFENGCLYTHCQAVMETKADFESMFEQCREVTEEYRSPTAGKAFGQMLLRLVAPLM